MINPNQSIALSEFLERLELLKQSYTGSDTDSDYDSDEDTESISDDESSIISTKPADSKLQLEIVESAPAFNEFQEVEKLPHTLLQFLIETVRPDNATTQKDQVDPALHNIKIAISKIKESIKEFFINGKGQSLLIAFNKFTNTLRSIFTEIIPGITSEIWSKVEQKILIPTEKNLKLAIAKFQKNYKEKSELIKNDAARKEIIAAAKGIINSREGRHTISSRKERKQGLKIALDHKEESALIEKRENLVEFLNDLREILKKEKLAPGDKETLEEADIEFPGDYINEDSRKEIFKKIKEAEKEYAKIISTLDAANIASTLLGSQNFISTTKKIIETRFKKQEPKKTR